MFRNATTRRLATLQYASVLVGLLTAACSGNLPLRYGETLCDPTHPCPAGSMCADSICVPDTRPDLDIPTPTDEFEGDWDNPFPGGENEVVPENFCRSDEQCGNGEACVDGRCRRTPCFGVTCPGAGDACAYQCIPTTAACNDVRCVDNFEHCVDGDCVPSCDIDPCEDPGCTGGPNCVAGECTNGTLCFGGTCREITPCGEDGDAFCGVGFLCSLGCNTPSLCDSITCNAGWTCTIQTDDMGIQFPTCIGSPCSGLSCGPGQSCIGGSCIDTCEFVPCADGGRECPSNSQICCNGTCCAEGEICRVIREDQPGQCLLPTGVCDPQCSDDQICVAGQCLCAEYPNPRACGGNECCRSKTCDNPCDPNPCATNPGNPLCTVDCNEPAGFRCVNDCGGVACPLLNTVCDPGTGDCLCGTPGSACTGTQCCVDNDPSAAVNLVCDDTCDPNPCTEAAFGDNRRCVRDCTQANGFRCENACTGVVCGPNMTCNPASGVCECGTDPDRFCNGGGQCCVNDAGTLDCRNPCASAPCGSLACRIDCAAPGGYTCVNGCAPGACSTDVRNPDCNPNGGACSCQNDSNGSYNICNTSQCCSDNGVCGNPCSPNPCPASGDPGNETRCITVCRTTGPDFDCVDPCAGNTCATANTGRNPDCRPDPGNPNAPQCFCDDTDPDSVCPSGSCCEPGGCATPCSPNRCPDDPGNPNDDRAGFTRCSVNCNDSNNYSCSDPCAGNSCSTQNGGRNPQCHAINGGQDAQCWCAVSNSVCAAGQCCLAGGCGDPCAGNPCNGIGICAPSCGSPGGYVCNPVCTTGNCPSQNPFCDPDERCECNDGDLCTGNECCVDNNGDNVRDLCADPCAGNPCGGSGVCVRNCTNPQGYTCNNPCNGVTCPNQNPQCDPTDPNPTTRCGCGSDTCVGAECCVSNTCDDACQPDPCTTSPNTRCINDCGQTAGFRCADPCAGNNCSSAQANKNPSCRPAGSNGDSAECYCDGTTDGVCGNNQCCGGSGCFNPCADPVAACGTTGQCVVDCSQPSRFRCDPVACSPSCVSPLVCDLSIGHCRCGTQDASTMSCGAPQQPVGTYPNACCDTDPGSGVALQCVARECTGNNQCRAVAGASPNCICDPCTGCAVPNGESGTCPQP